MGAKYANRAEASRTVLQGVFLGTWTMEADAAAGHSISGSFSKDPFGLDEKQVHRIHPISSGGATLCVLCHADPATSRGAHIEMPVNWGERAYM